jgi:hypothetical protein
VQTLFASAVVTKPAEQLVHEVDPDDDEYLPAGQLVQEEARPSGSL